MSRFSKPVVEPQAAQAPAKPSGRCDNPTCGWDFRMTHREEMVNEPGRFRTVTRTEICRPVHKNGVLVRIETICDVCHARELDASRHGRYSDVPGVAAIHREALGIGRKP